ncbi:MAG TPA: alpha-amylase family glycosyl hydrolase [Candidatus Sulfopaludibacter sp.]|nr:alpha-amylase family glycosyl hydrolase [Candidatus Sulfopaludibacter sp.]
MAAPVILRYDPTMFLSSTSFVDAPNFKRSILRTVSSILVLAAFAPVTKLPAQSTRPGWGSTPYQDASGTGVTFRVWAPNAASVTTPGAFNGWSTSATPLVNELSNGLPTGVWSADVPGATAGQQYKYYITYNGSSNYKHDPRSRWVVNAGGGSGNNDIIYDPTAFNWNGDDFTNPPLQDLFIYELHMGTFPSSTVPSRLVAATNKLDYLKYLGVNAVELMPIMEFGNSGNSWGYDPAQLFAVDNAQYGGPDALKTFVQACHARGIAVLLDVVHNHYGPNLLDMWNFDGWAGSNSVGGGGIYFFQSNFNLQNTPYGATRPNVSSNQVANFISDNIAMWLSECHVDGFRWDSVYTLTHGNDGTYIPTAGNLVTAINAMIHTNYTGKISIAEDVYNTWGFDSSWDTGYPYNFTPVLTNMSDASRNMSTIANDVQYNVSYGGTASFLRVAYLESHDVVGDLNGSTHVRLPTAIDPVTPNSYRARKLSTLGAAITLTAPGIPMIFQGQEMLENQQFDSGRNVDWSKTNTYSYIVQFYHDLINARRNLQGLTPGLEGDRCTMLAVDNVNKLVAFNRWNSANPSLSAVVVGNFTSNTLNNYSLTFPSAGNWYVQLNSDSTTYGPDYGNIGSSVVTASGSPATGNVTIGPYSALILSQISPVPTLSIAPTVNGVTVSWPMTPPGVVLQSCPSLADNPPVWTQVPVSQYQTNGSTIFINVSAPTDTVFYRLQQP